jgi:hypothetical protein
MKFTLTKRIVWCAPTKANPSYNHAWFSWDHRHQGPPECATRRLILRDGVVYPSKKNLQNPQRFDSPRYNHQ